MSNHRGAWRWVYRGSQPLGMIEQSGDDELWFAIAFGEYYRAGPFDDAISAEDFLRRSVPVLLPGKRSKTAA